MSGKCSCHNYSCYDPDMLEYLSLMRRAELKAEDIVCLSACLMHVGSQLKVVLINIQCIVNYFL